MDKQRVARELVKLAKELTGAEDIRKKVSKAQYILRNELEDQLLDADFLVNRSGLINRSGNVPDEWTTAMKDAKKAISTIDDALKKLYKASQKV